MGIIKWLASLGQEELQTRVRHDRLQKVSIYKIEAYGSMPIDEVTIRWECRLVDHNTGNPILTLVSSLQEKDSMIYFFQGPKNHVPRGGFIDQWRTVAIVPDEDVLVAPYSGRRDVRIVLDLDYWDVGAAQWRTIKQFTHSLALNFELSGYVEEEEKKQEARVLTVKLAVGMALADGHLDRAEGQVVQRWIRRRAGEFNDEEEFQAFKKSCNDAMRETDARVRAGRFSLAEVARELADVGNPRWKYEAIELLHKIAAVDGVAQEEETRMLRSLSDLLNLESKEVERIRDKEFMKLPVDDLFSGSILTELGIPEDASPDEIKKKLRAEFRKWSGRLNALPEGEEREYAQQMIDRIAETRKQYE